MKRPLLLLLLLAWPAVPESKLPGAWCLGLALTGFAIAAAGIVYLWRISGED